MVSVKQELCLLSDRFEFEKINLLIMSYIAAHSLNHDFVEIENYMEQ